MAEASGFGMVRVDETELRSRAEDAYTKIGQYRTALGEIASAMSGSASYWEGQAGNLYREVMSMQMKEIEEAITEYSNYPKELLEYAGIYSEVIASTEQKAEEIASLEMF